MRRRAAMVAFICAAGSSITVPSSGSGAHAATGGTISDGDVEFVFDGVLLSSTRSNGVIAVGPPTAIAVYFNRSSGLSVEQDNSGWDWVPAQRLTQDGTALLAATRESHLPSDGGDDADIYRFDLASRTWQQLTNGIPPAGSTQYDATAWWDFKVTDVSDDGRYIALHGTSATLADQGAFRYDLATNTLRQVDPFTPGTSYQPQADVSMSADGRYLAYRDGEVIGCTGCFHVYVYDTMTGTRTMVDVTSGGQPTNRNAATAMIAPGGRHVLFWSDATNLATAEPYPPTTRWFVADLKSGEVWPVGDGGSNRSGSISADGQRVAFVAAPSTGARDQAYVYDHTQGRTELISEHAGATPWEATSVTIAADGSEVLFGARWAELSPPPPNLRVVTFARSLRTEAAPSPPQPTLIGLPPGRIVDTRQGGSTVDGLEAGTGSLAAGDTLRVHVAERGGVGAQPHAVAVNVTVTEATGAGYVTVWPCGALPTASNLNIVDVTVANLVLSAVDAEGDFCVRSSTRTHLVIDVTGWVPGGADYHATNPARLLDTRAGAPTIDGLGAPGSAIPAGETVELAVAGRGGVPSGSSAVALNVTATDSDGDGYVTVWPCGATPNASNVNVTAGRTAAGLVLTGLSPTGTVCLRAGDAGVHMIADVQGFVDATASLIPIHPQRLLDSRVGATTVDAMSQGLGAIAADNSVRVQVAGRGGVPSTAEAALVNVTAVGATGTGYVTVWPCGVPPNASTLNVAGSGTVANAAVAALDADGAVCIKPSEATMNLILDVMAYTPG